MDDRSGLRGVACAALAAMLAGCAAGGAPAPAPKAEGNQAAAAKPGEKGSAPAETAAVKPDEPAAPPPTEEEIIQDAVKLLLKTRTQTEQAVLNPPGAPGRMPGRPPAPGGKKPKTPAQEMKAAFDKIEALAKVDKKKAGEAIVEAMEKDQARYYLMLALGRVGGEPAISALRKNTLVWSGAASAEWDEYEGQAAAALLAKNGVPEPFEKVLKAHAKAIEEEEFLMYDESIHYLVLGRLMALAGRNEEALEDLRKVKQLRLNPGATPKQVAQLEPDFHELWTDPAFAQIVNGWKGRPAIPPTGSGYLGLQPSMIEKDERAEYGMGPKEKGVLVQLVMEGTPAEKGGLLAEDVILAVDGQKVRDPMDLTTKISSNPAGAEVTLAILRKKERQELKIVLGKRPPPEPMPGQPQQQQQPEEK